MLQAAAIFKKCFHIMCYWKIIISDLGETDGLQGQNSLLDTNRSFKAVMAIWACVEGLRFESDSRPWLDAHSLFSQQRIGTWWQHWGNRGGEERNWPPYLTCRWLRISFLSNRHSPTYESVRDYLYNLIIPYSKKQK